MRVKATADLHGNLPAFWEGMNPGDLMIVAGDVCPDYLGKVEKYTIEDNGATYQLAWLDTEFRGWLQEFRDRGILVCGIAGNHDFVFDKMGAAVDDLRLPWWYLKDTETTLNGLRIYGTPWVPGLPRWAFWKDAEKLAMRAEAIPKGLDILVTHGPPLGTADACPQPVGDPALRTAIAEKQPGVVVCGHIHEGFGVYDVEFETKPNVRLYNVAHVDEFYDPIRPALTIWEANRA